MLGQKVKRGDPLVILDSPDIGKARLWMTKHIVDSKRGYELANIDMAQPIPWPADE